VRKCLFCDAIPKTLEHIWPTWILQRIGPQSAIRGSSGPRSVLLRGPKPQLKARCVCKACNEGWMSDLESTNKPLIAAMMRDLSIPLKSSQQSTLACWGVKTSMVMECTLGHRQQFYTKSEREVLRTRRTIPANTFVWLGRSLGLDSVAHWGSDVWEEQPLGPDILHSYVNTIGVCSFLIQVMTVHVPAVYRRRPINIKPRPTFQRWSTVLTRIWPSNKAVEWPPALAIRAANGPSFEDVHTRWGPEADELR